MCLPGLCDPFDLEDCFCGSGFGYNARQMRKRPAQQYSNGQQRAGVPAAVRAQRPVQNQGMRQISEPTATELVGNSIGHITGSNGTIKFGSIAGDNVNCLRTAGRSIALVGVSRRNDPAKQGELVSGIVKTVKTGARRFTNAEYFRTTKEGWIVLKGGNWTNA
ncbi:hypothetical protein N7493_000155 [Penicillium malachiteum]|uniref:Uncharacterized protein n=1 Tax=Penicillium malachiteum TaxID=1324776 RepID=A0AAD6HWF0_9EURO|nr:hypothetical protein N7493_000155 [Penicillium malachiteum]